MRSPTPVWLKPLGLTALVVIAGVLAMWVAAPNVPSHSGKTAEQWFVRLTDESAAVQQDALEAFRAMGSESLPFLMTQVRSGRPLITAQAKDWIQSRILKRPVAADCGLSAMSENFIRQTRLSKAFGALGNAGSSAVPKLSRLMSNQFCADEAASSLAAIGVEGVEELGRAQENKDVTVRQVAVFALGSVTTERDLAVKYLLQAIADSDVVVRHYAAYSLGQVATQPQLSVAALTTVLSDSDPLVRYNSVMALQQFGAAARSALPALRKLHDDSEQIVRKASFEVVAALESNSQLETER